MRLTSCAFLVVALGLVVSARADDEKGFIGVQLKIEDGKIVVVETIKDGPAEKAGVKADDVILKVNDFKVKENAEEEDLKATVEAVGKNKPGDKIKLTVKRGDKEMTIDITAGKRPE